MSDPVFPSATQPAPQPATAAPAATTKITPRPIVARPPVQPVATPPVSLPPPPPPPNEQLRSRQDDPAVASLLRRVLNTNASVDKFWMVEVGEDDFPTLRRFNNVDELVTAIQERLGKPYHLFPFMGHALQITEPPLSFLRTPYGDIPLFDIPNPEDATARVGWVGTDPLPVATTAPPIVAEATNAVEADDTDDDMDHEHTIDDDEDSPIHG